MVRLPAQLSLLRARVCNRDSQLTPLRLSPSLLSQPLHCLQHCTLPLHTNAIAAAKMSPEGAALAQYIRELNGDCNTKLDLCARLPCDGDAERSVVALQDIKAGEILIRVPVEGCLRGGGDAVAKELAARLHKSSDPYVATLPTTPPGLETWTPAERVLLRGTRLEHCLKGGDADRAALLVRTRCVRVSEDQVAMVPGVDALNDASGRAPLRPPL